MNRARITLRCKSKAVPRPLGSVRGQAMSVGPLPHGCGTVGRAAGFTLVELLVVVAVLLILMAMTITALDFTFTSERIRSGARQVQSALEGARDRAIFAKEPRGLRLLVDPDDPRIVTSLMYVGASKDWSEGRIRLERPDFEEDANGNGTRDGGEPDSNGNGRLDGNGVADSTETTIVRGSPDCGWYTLKERGFLGVFEDWNLNGVLDAGEDQNGNGALDRDTPRIKIPADDTGQWHVALTYRLTAADQILVLIPSYKGKGTSPETQVVAFLGTGPSRYILELPPRLLPDAQPILLPEGVCIDLDGSDVPPDWRPPPGTGLTAPYSSHMDILFSSRGVVTGPLAAKGLLNLYLAERTDVIRAVGIGVEVGGTPTPRPPVNNVPGAVALVPDVNQFNPDEQIGQRKVIAIFTQTGKVSTHEVDPTPKSTPDGFAFDPFHYATRGEAQSQ